MKEQELLERIRKTLDESVGQMDAGTRSRLNQARQRALEMAGSGPGDSVRNWWIPAGGVAMVTVAVLSGVLYFQSASRMPGTDGVEDMEIIAAKDHLELYEKLDFYQWLLEEGNSAG